MTNDPLNPGHGRLGGRNMLLTIAVLALVWLAAAWGIANHLARRRASRALAEGQARLDQHVASTATGVANYLKLLHGIPSALGRSGEIQQTLRRFQATPPAKPGVPLAADPSLAKVDGLLEGYSGGLRALSVIWVLNPAGTCVAAPAFRKLRRLPACALAGLLMKLLLVILVTLVTC